MPLGEAPGRRGRALSREPGDLPATGLTSIPRVEGERDENMSTTTLAPTGLLGDPAARYRRPPRPLHRRLRRLLASRRGCTTPATTTGIPWPSPATEERRVTCRSFAIIFFLAFAVGMIVGLAMTVMQARFTVPLIVAAETFEGAAPAETTAHTHDAATPAHSHDEDAVPRPPTASSAWPLPSPPTSSPPSALRSC